MNDAPTFISHADEVRFYLGHKLIAVVSRGNLPHLMRAVAESAISGAGHVVSEGVVIPHDKLGALMYEAAKAMTGR